MLKLEVKPVFQTIYNSFHSASLHLAISIEIVKFYIAYIRANEST